MMPTMKTWLKRALFTTALILVVFGYALLLWKGPWWIDGDHLRRSNLQPADGVVITGVRTALVALGAGVIAALGLYYTHRTLEQTRKRDDEHARATAEGQINDRYVEAVKLLASADSLTQRLGGIYALERNMHDSDRDHPTVIAILSAFVRSSAPVNKEGTAPGDSADDELPQDVQAALTVIGGRPPREPAVRPDLSHTNLTNADLIDADLTHAFLMVANLTRASLQDADLTNAYLMSVELTDANLTNADLRDADLTNANLLNANLRATDLTDAKLQGVRLTDVDQLLRTRLTSSTQLSAEIADDPRVQQRIADCLEAYPRLPPDTIRTSDIMNADPILPRRAPPPETPE